MKNTSKKNEYDVIVVGSGTCGATIARELSRKKKKVLILERGSNVPLKEDFLTLATISNRVSVGGKLQTMRAITTGGSTGIYFAVAELPPLDTYTSFGIDLSKALEEAKNELPLVQLPDEFLGAQSIKLKESAIELGYSWEKHLMLIDLSKCANSYSFEAKWRAKSYVEDAVNEGATLINRATVHKIIIENNKAIGVEYKLKSGMIGSEVCQAYGTKIVLASGVLSSPKILKDSGLKDIGKDGFYCDPGFAMLGIIPGLKGKESFLGSMSSDFQDDIAIADGNLNRFFYKMLTIATLRIKHYNSFTSSIGVGVKVKDSLAGKMLENGHFYKELTKTELEKIKIGEERATKILKNAGAKNIIRSVVSAGQVAGVIKLQEDLDNNLETKYKNLYVCDGSIIPEKNRVSPTLTLICLAKYLAKHLSSSL
ncbi:MAG: NAD(P)-binding protein [Bacteroidales bacterium]|nr:NAD(P)-binding protein [Bacteroidales bacterium]